MGPRAGLDRYGKCRPHRDSIPGPYSPSELSGMEVEEKIEMREGIEAGRRISDVVSAKSRTLFVL